MDNHDQPPEIGLAQQDESLLLIGMLRDGNG
jgi:hypothetical protein